MYRSLPNPASHVRLSLLRMCLFSSKRFIAMFVFAVCGLLLTKILISSVWTRVLNFFTPELPTLQQHIISYCVFFFSLNALKCTAKAPTVDPSFEAEHQRHTETTLLTPKSIHVLFILKTSLGSKHFCLHHFRIRMTRTP